MVNAYPFCPRALDVQMMWSLIYSQIIDEYRKLMSALRLILDGFRILSLNNHHFFVYTKLYHNFIWKEFQTVHVFKHEKIFKKIEGS